MTEQALPAPLVPAEVDLTDFKFMPLDVQRLRDSDLASEETPEACWAAVLLWCASWHQQPPGSIPDSDQWQAKHTGYVSRGKIDKAWADVRPGALRNWQLCSDGRLYHPVVAEKALTAWAEKLAQRARTKAATEAREAKRRAQQKSTDVDRDDSEESTLRTTSRSKNESKGQGQGQGQGLSNTSNLAVAPALRSEERPQLELGEPAPKTWEPPDCPHLDVLALWAEVLPAMPQHLPTQWKGTRADHLRTRWRETATEKRWDSAADGLEYLRKLFAYVGKSPFLTGRATPAQGKRPFVIELEWLVAPSNWAKVIEGKYHQENAA